MPPVDSAHLIVERVSEFANNILPCVLVVDGRDRGELAVGRSVKRGVDAGERRWHVRIAASESNPFGATLAPGEEVVLQCGSPRLMPGDTARVLTGLGRTFALWPAFDLALAWFSRGLHLAASLDDEERTANDPRWRDALVAFERGSELRPTDPLGPFWIGRLRAALGLDGALASLEQARGLAPERLATWLEIARNRLDVDSTAALEAIDEAARLAPDDHEVALLRCELLAASGSERAALEAAEALPGHRAYVLRRELSERLGLPDPADEEFGRLFLEEYRRLSGGYGELSYEIIQRVKVASRADFLRALRAGAARLREKDREVILRSSPQAVAQEYRRVLWSLHNGGTPLIDQGQVWIQLATALAGRF